MRSTALVVLLLLAGCGQTIPTFPGLDSGIECTSSAPAPAGDGGARDAGPAMDAGPSRQCQTGYVCLVGHCYAPCMTDSQCLPSEACTGGVCASRSGPPHDGGPVDMTVDTGPPDMGPCGHVMCSDAGAPACNPVTGACVECAASDGCPGVAAPACDIAQGVCRPFVAALCAPCRASVDCSGIGAGFTYECVMHSSPYERVCLAVCGSGGTCPYGMRCDTDSHCVPSLGSCTSWHAAAESRMCTTDADCAPLGATASDFLYPGICNAGHCAQPCGIPTDCQSMSQTCGSTGICM